MIVTTQLQMDALRRHERRLRLPLRTLQELDQPTHYNDTYEKELTHIKATLENLHKITRNFLNLSKALSHVSQKQKSLQVHLLTTRKPMYACFGFNLS